MSPTVKKDLNLIYPTSRVVAIGQGFFVGNSTSRAGVLLVTVPQLLKPLRLLKGFNSCVGNYILDSLAGD